MFDAIIIGGGPAGLSAALVLGRCHRSVIVIDSGTPRNNNVTAMHGYLTRDGIDPLEFNALAKVELRKYKVKFKHDLVVSINKKDNTFVVSTESKKEYHGKKILLATGVKDNIPNIKGFKELYPYAIHHCPYCDGWESTNKRIAVFANGKAAYDLSLALLTWSNDLVILTNGESKLNKLQLENLKNKKIKIITKKIVEVAGKRRRLKGIKFEDNSFIEREIIFFSKGFKQQSNFAKILGCRLSKRGFIFFKKNQETSVSGVYAAGDACLDIKFVVNAAAEGAKAAVSINISLTQEERHRKS